MKTWIWIVELAVSVSVWYGGWNSVTAESFAGERGTFYAVDYGPSVTPGELVYGAKWRMWIPDGPKTLRGVILHQHGCGDGSAKPGHTCVEDWHWQALARKFDCALMAVSYQQTGACELWCDPRNGSEKSFQNALADFAKESGHPELTVVPWAIWGHSGGGHWTASMVQLYPERVLVAWCRSGHPNTVGNIFDELPLGEKVADVPMILNLGVREKTEFRKIWDEGFPYVKKMRENGAKIAIFMDPKTGHCCGDSRYPAIRFFEICLTARLPEMAGSAEMKPMTGGVEVSAEEIWAEYQKNPEIGENNEKLLVGEKLKPFLTEGFWLPSTDYVGYWRSYQLDGNPCDESAPEKPFCVKRSVNAEEKTEISWEADADLESGLASFIIEADGVEIGRVTGGKHSVGFPVYQGLMYSDTPYQPVSGRKFIVPENVKVSDSTRFSVRSVNVCGLVSEAGMEGE